MIKAVVRFTGVGGSNWTELYYFTGTFSAGSLPFTQQMIASRLTFLDNQARMRSVRYSNPDGGVRASAPIEINQAGTYVSAGASASQPGTYLSYTMSSVTPLATRKVKFHGLNTSMYSIDQASGDPQVSAQVNAKVIGFISLLVVGGGVIRCLTRGVTLGAGLSQITQAARDVTNAKNTVITTLQNHGIGTGAMALIRGADKKVLPGLTGSFKVLAQDAKTLTINYTMPTASVAVSSGCFVRANEFVPAAAIVTGGFHSIGTGKVRESFFESRGARSGNKIRHLA